MTFRISRWTITQYVAPAIEAKRALRDAEVFAAEVDAMIQEMDRALAARKQDQAIADQIAYRESWERLENERWQANEAIRRSNPSICI